MWHPCDSSFYSILYGIQTAEGVAAEGGWGRAGRHQRGQVHERYHSWRAAWSVCAGDLFIRLPRSAAARRISSAGTAPLALLALRVPQHVLAQKTRAISARITIALFAPSRHAYGVAARVWLDGIVLARFPQSAASRCLTRPLFVPHSTTVDHLDRDARRH